jgi:type II secretory pathway component PulK
MNFQRQSGDRGVALVVVLWAVGLISSALLGLSLMFQAQLDQEVAALQTARAMLVAESGIQMCLHREIGPEDVQEASRQLSARLKDGWRVPAEFEVGLEKMESEEARLNLNYWLHPAREKQARIILQNLFAGWGVNLDTSVRVIDCLLDWVDPDDFARSQGAEKDDYREQKLGRPRNGRIEDLRELENVIGWSVMAKEAREGPQAVDWRGKFTLYGTGKLSLKTADQDLIEAVLEMAPGSASTFVAARVGPDMQLGTRDDVVNPGLLPRVSPELLQERASSGETDLWRVSSTGKVGEVKRTLVALLTRNPPQVLARWLEENQP